MVDIVSRSGKEKEIMDNVKREEKSGEEEKKRETSLAK